MRGGYEYVRMVMNTNISRGIFGHTPFLVVGC